MSYEKQSGYTGGLIEEEMLDKCVGWDNQYMPFDESVDFVKSHQPEGWRTTDPKPRFAGDLYTHVALSLLGPEADWGNLNFYTAVDSPLDVYHGIDGFFEYEGKIVTIDLTINTSKVEAKADFVINPDEADPVVVAEGIANRFMPAKKKAA